MSHNWIAAIAVILMSCDGIVDAADYDVWRAHFGQTAGSGAGARANFAVPEPTTLVLMLVATAGIFTRRRPDIAQVSKLIHV